MRTTVNEMKGTMERIKNKLNQAKYSINWKRGHLKLQTYLRDAVGLVPEYHNKVNITTK